MADNAGRAERRGSDADAASLHQPSPATSVRVRTLARFRAVSKYQVSGWRFLLHRIQHALVRREVSMIDDPQRGHSSALVIGVVLALLGVAGSAALAFFNSQHGIENSPIISEKKSGALYANIGKRLYPVLNLASARLITDSASDPVQVPESIIEKYPKGPLVGIPGAPGQLIGSNDRTSAWMACDSAQNGVAVPLDPHTGLPTVELPSVHTTLSSVVATIQPGDDEKLNNDAARLFYDGSQGWLVYRDSAGEVVRAAIDMRDSAVTLALGLDADSAVLPVSKGLIAAIPRVPALTVPVVPGAGTAVELTSGLTARVGSVLTESTTGQGAAYYLVLQTGLVRVSPVVADMVRNANSEGIPSAQTVAPDVVAANVRPGGWPGAANYPPHPVHLVDPENEPVTCYTWLHSASDPTAQEDMIVGRKLPLTSSQRAAVVPLVTTASYWAYMPPTTGRFVQVTGDNPASPLQESLWWISDSGIRYGIDTHNPDGTTSADSVKALGIGTPVPAPWSIVKLFAPGPTLSKSDAMVQHDGIAPDANASVFNPPNGG